MFIQIVLNVLNLRVHRNVDYFNLIPAFAIAKLASSCQFHFTETCAFTYKGVSQSSYKTLIIMLGQTYPNIHMDLYSNFYFNKNNY